MKISSVARNLFRGSRPEGPPDLLTLGLNNGVKTIISLETGFGRFWDGLTGKDFDERRAWEKGWHRTYISRPCSNFTPPGRADTEVILRDIENGLKLGPVFLHCHSGVDRTGWIVASWRVLQEGAVPEVAWEECLKMGMHKRFSFWKSAFMQEIAK